MEGDVEKTIPPTILKKDAIKRVSLRLDFIFCVNFEISIPEILPINSTAATIELGSPPSFRKVVIKLGMLMASPYMIKY